MRTLLILLLFCPVAWAAKTTIETMTPKYRDAQELVRVIEPLLSEGASVQTYNGQLIIKGDKQDIETLVSLIEKLDTKPQRLMITFSQGADKPSTQFTVDKDGRVTYGPHEGLPTSERQKVYQTSRESKRSITHLSLNAGEKAFLQSGVSIPIVLYDEGFASEYAGNASATRQSQSQSNQVSGTFPADEGTTVAVPNNQNPLVALEPNPTAGDDDEVDPSLILSIPPSDNALINVEPNDEANVEIDLRNTTSSSQAQRQRQYNGQARGFANQRVLKELKSGVYVAPTMAGDQVRLHVISIEERAHDHHRHNAARNQPGYASQSMETTIMAPLSTWVYLGGNQKETEIAGQSWHHSTRDRKLDRSHIWVRVDLIE